MKELSELVLSDKARYAEDHEWVSTSAPYRVGVSDFAQSQLGDLIFVEMPDVGTVLAAGDEFGSLESTKSVSPLVSPISGKVVAVNEALADDPARVNNDAGGEGWIIEIEPSNLGELDALMDLVAYKKHLEEIA